MNKLIEVPVCLAAAGLIGIGTFRFFNQDLFKHNFTPFTDAIMEITEVQSASQAAVMFDPYLEKRAPLVVEVEPGYLWADQRSWSVIG